MVEKSYLIRFGIMSHVGRFMPLPTCEEPLERGQFVVIQTDRGLELGEILLAGDPGALHAETGRTYRRGPRRWGRRAAV